VALVYNRLPCDISGLLEIRENIFVIDEDMADSFAATGTLQNGGFEAVRARPPANWARRQSNNQPTFLFPEPGQNGGSCAGIKMSAAAPYKPWPVARWQQKVAVQPGTTCVIGGWIKTDDIAGEGGARLAIQWRNSSNKALKTAEVMPYLGGNNSWSYYEYRVRAPAEAATCYVCLELAGCSGTVWFDDIVFKAE